MFGTFALISRLLVACLLNFVGFVDYAEVPGMIGLFLEMIVIVCGFYVFDIRLRMLYI